MLRHEQVLLPYRLILKESSSKDVVEVLQPRECGTISCSPLFGSLCQKISHFEFSCHLLGQSRYILATDQP